MPGIFHENNITNSIEVFPNPAEKRINVTINSKEINGLFYSSLITSEGKTVQKSTLNKYSQSYEYQLDITNLPIGVYFLIISDGKYSGLQKVVIK